MPTRRGITVGVVGLALIVAGLVASYRELVALGAVAVLALLLAFLWAGWPPRLTVRRTIDPDRVVRGDDCRAEVDLRSTARWRAQHLIGVEYLSDGAGAAARGEVATPVAGRRTSSGTDSVGAQEDPAPDSRGAAPDTFVGTVPVPAVRLRAGAATRTGYALPTDRRGVLDVGPLEVSRQDPLGLVSASRRYGGTTRLWVHPRAHRLARVPVGAARSLDGVVDAVQYGSITFHALREYVPGDDLRHVHWRTSARVGELMVREHVDTSLPRIVVLVDDRAAAHTPESMEETAEAAASVLLAALRAELTVELHLVSGRLVAGGGPGMAGPSGGRARPYLDLLAELAPAHDASLPRAVQKLRQRHRGDTLVLLTGSGGTADLDSAGLLRDVYPTVVVGVLGETSGDGLAGRTLPGVIALTAGTAEQFAARWDGVSTW